MWTTKKREFWITQDKERPIYRCIGHEIIARKCRLLAIGGMPDHVHVVVSMRSTVCAATLAQEMKGLSSVLANKKLGFEGAFDWQDNYAAFSVGSELDAVITYVQRQKEHHASGDLWPDWEETYEEV